jgi:calcium-dependent protein kinase
VLEAIKKLNDCGIVHRDIKPENILISKEGDIKIIDFGLARVYINSMFNDVVGSPYYIAPEVLMAQHGPACDIWSIGVLMYIMLCGYLPFSGESPNQVFAKIIKGNLRMDQPEWDFYSEESKDLINKMLVVSPSERITASEALEHDWFTLDEDVSTI